MVLGLLLTGITLLAAGYLLYGRFLERRFEVDEHRATPAERLQDGIDYVPSKPGLLLGHHFSSIAGAGPIVGPIIAAAAFGWLPAVVWVIFGSILIGGVQDFASLMASVRHEARSVADLANEEISPFARLLFLVFVWFALVYVVVVFVDLTAATFASEPGVASSSMMYIALAVALGLIVRKAGVGLGKASLIFVPAVFFAVWAGQRLPLALPVEDGASVWSLILLGYCFIASVLPVWFLLQPRDYLSSFLLYACLFGGIVGVLLGGGGVAAGAEAVPAIASFRDANLGYLFPAMFITIACGACSGFHSVVSSGTTAKQLANEKHAKPIAYGGMLIEGLLAIISISTVAIVGLSAARGQAPTVVFSTGVGQLFGALGIPEQAGMQFGALAVSTFLLTTLDTCTRLGRYVVAELFRIPNGNVPMVIVATAATLALPVLMTQITLTLPDGTPAPAWKVIWPVFGATNQLLGALAMLAVTAWLRNTGRKVAFIALPMTFMFSVTLVALYQLVVRYKPTTLVGGISAGLLLLALVLLIEATRQFFKPPKQRHPQPA